MLPEAAVAVGRPPVVWVAPDAWRPAVVALRDGLGLDSFDRLTAVDEGDGTVTVVLHLWSVVRRAGLLVTTPATDRIASLSPVFAGAAWHEREAAEMFGLNFEGHPGLEPLLLPPGFAGAPLRKEFVLASRVVVPWPGAPEPGESVADARAARPSRRRAAPLGVPKPGA